MKTLLKFLALAEGATGLILVIYPPIVRVLFGGTIAGPGINMSRLAGLCLIALCVACWPDNGSRRGFYGMLAWSLLAMFYLTAVGLGGQTGILLWPAVVVHVAIAILLVRAWMAQRKQPQ